MVVVADNTRRRRLVCFSPVALLKNINNSVELHGFHASHLRDAAALTQYQLGRGTPVALAVSKTVIHTIQTQLQSLTVFARAGQEVFKIQSVEFSTYSIRSIGKLSCWPDNTNKYMDVSCQKCQLFTRERYCKIGKDNFLNCTASHTWVCLHRIQGYYLTEVSKVLYSWTVQCVCTVYNVQ